MATLHTGNIRHRRAEARRVAKAAKTRRIERAVEQAISDAIATGKPVFIAGSRPGMNLGRHVSKAMARRTRQRRA